MRYIIPFLILFSCAPSDYYTSKEYKIKQRQKESLKMFNETHNVRKKCAPRSKRPKNSKRRRKYYS